MTSIEQFYSYTENFHPHPTLDYLITNLRFDDIEIRLKGFLAHIQNESATQGVDKSVCWRTVINFVSSVLDFLSPISSSSPTSKLKSSVLHLERMYSFLKPVRQLRPRKIRAIPRSVVEELYETTTPGNTRNPFRGVRNQIRNQLIFMLLLHQGLRKGELLSLRADALKHEYDAIGKRDRYWLNVVPPLLHDVRLRQPSLKNQSSVRQIPVGRELANYIINYSTNWRQRSHHGFLLGSNFNRPMSLRSLAYMMDRLSATLSPASLKVLKEQNSSSKITPHDFRHTCAILRLRNFVDRGIEMGEAEILLRAFFGWSRDSSMPRLYAKAYYDERLQDIWEASFDNRTSLLRAIESGNRTS